jgi:uncharacterized protein YjiS (DUF1127 family)
VLDAVKLREGIKMTLLIKLYRGQVVLLNVLRAMLNYSQVMLGQLRKYRELSRQRKLLAQLPDYLLKDMGISRADALNEASKKFWK